MLSKLSRSNSSQGFLSIPLFAVLLIFLAIACIGFYELKVNHRQTSVIPERLLRVPKGSLTGTYIYNGKVFPNLPTGYSLVYQYSTPDSHSRAEYLTVRSISEVRSDVISICKVHKFIFQPNGNSGNVECIDTDNTWLFIFSDSSKIEKQSWAKKIDQNSSAYSQTWLEVMSNGRPVIN